MSGDYTANWGAISREYLILSYLILIDVVIGGSVFLLVIICIGLYPMNIPLRIQPPFNVKRYVTVEFSAPISNMGGGYIFSGEPLDNSLTLHKGFSNRSLTLS